MSQSRKPLSLPDGSLEKRHAYEGGSVPAEGRRRLAGRGPEDIMRGCCWRWPERLRSNRGAGAREVRTSTRVAPDGPLSGRGGQYRAVRTQYENRVPCAARPPASPETQLASPTGPWLELNPDGGDATMSDRSKRRGLSPTLPSLLPVCLADSPSPQSHPIPSRSRTHAPAPAACLAELLLRITSKASTRRFAQPPPPQGGRASMRKGNAYEELLSNLPPSSVAPLPQSDPSS